MNAKLLVIDGAYAPLFESFVEFKRSVGYVYPRQIVEDLRHFSRFINTFPEIKTVMDKEMVDAYCALKDGEAISTRNKRAILVRQFALYLRTKGIECYLPPKNHERCRNNFIPYIITEDEMSQIIACADSQPYRPSSSTSKAVYSMLIRMLWCCGLRLGEALALTVGDVNLDDAVLTIKKAKFNKTRLVPMSEQITHYSRIYWKQMGFIRENPNAFFYPNHRKEKYVRSGVSSHIKKIMREAGIIYDGYKVPRTHDIRHSFAVRSLKKMEESGMDVFCSLPLLSAYMGHCDIKSTEYYLRLTDNAFSEITNAMCQCYEGRFSGGGLR